MRSKRNRMWTAVLLLVSLALIATAAGCGPAPEPEVVEKVVTQVVDRDGRSSKAKPRWSKKSSPRWSRSKWRR